MYWVTSTVLVVEQLTQSRVQSSLDRLYVLCSRGVFDFLWFV